MRVSKFDRRICRFLLDGTQTVVVEYESGGDGGAFGVGTAPAGSAALERLIAAARSEADALAVAGGWAAVRVGFGDAETIDCETGRTVYVAG